MQVQDIKLSSHPSHKVFVALSGGVDSSVSIAILKNIGFHVVGVFMKNWSGDEYGLQDNCPWEQDQKDAENVCKHLGVEFLSFNFEKEYRNTVIEYFLNEYKKGRTPNPDIMCNKEIKFKLFLEKSLQLGANFIATGHYAQNDTLNFILDSNKYDLNNNNLYRSVDTNKDQTYFLANITFEQLNKTIFPIGNLTKSQVRNIADKYKLPNAQKKDSQGICFVGSINVRKFLGLSLPKMPGDIIDIDTHKKVGKHEGIFLYTIGQRSGLGIGGSIEPYYVVKKDVKNNLIYVAKGSNNPYLFKKTVHLENLHIINKTNFDLNNKVFIDKEIKGVIRYRQSSINITLNKIDLQNLKEVSGSYFLEDKNVATFEFSQPVKGVAPGQSLVIYSGNKCIGGGVITFAE